MSKRKKEKVHRCFSCGKKTKEFEILPNGNKWWVCQNNECLKDFEDESWAMKILARELAEDDGYSAYY